MLKRFDDHLLDSFAQNFYGYGNYRGQFWFIGMEEGGGNSFTNVAKRLSAWAERGERELEDLAEYHSAIGITHLFSDRPKLQPTWNKLIRILLSIGGRTPTRKQVREYQRVSLGRQKENTCLLELLPLPSPSTGHWLYSQHSRLPYLEDRQSYNQALVASRIAHLKRRIAKHKPTAVVFYSFNYYEHWQAIAEVDLLEKSDGIYVGRNHSTLFVMTRHPAVRGVTNDYFHQVGRLISTVPKHQEPA